MNHISSYPSIYALGHRAIADIFKTPVLVEEKCDGSQYSFGRINDEFVCRSKGKDIIPDAPEKMFERAIEVSKGLDLHDGWIYRGEYLSKPGHNSLVYNRVPHQNIVIFDIQTAPETYLSCEEKRAEAERIGLECVPVLHNGQVDSIEMFRTFLDREAMLGGCKIEGVVVKNYSLFTVDKKVAMGKYVSEAFKEIHTSKWKISNPTQTDIVQQLIATFKTDARWNKAIQHLKEAGQLEGSPRDIGLLIKEIPNDIQKECEEQIKDVLFAHFWPHIRRGVTAGLPEFYKDKLAQTAFTEQPGV